MIVKDALIRLAENHRAELDSYIVEGRKARETLLKDMSEVES